MAATLFYISNCRDGKGYFFDPNYGLIKCKEDEPHAKTYVMLLSMYEPPLMVNNFDPAKGGTKIDSETNRPAAQIPFKGNSLEANYQIQINKYTAGPLKS